MVRRAFRSLLTYFVYLNNQWHKFESIQTAGADQPAGDKATEAEAGAVERVLELGEFKVGCRMVALKLPAAEVEGGFRDLANGAQGVAFLEFVCWCARRAASSAA